VRRARAARPADLRVLVVNDAYRLIPSADVLYACDAKWWRLHEGARGFAGERWTQDVGADQAAAIAEFGLSCVASVAGDVPSLGGVRIAQGLNSGFQGVNFAAGRGGRRLILLGFDMGAAPDGRRHFFGDHAGPLNENSPYDLFIKAFMKAAPLYAQAGVVIVNASRRTALKCFRRTHLEEELD
jgi:hypothetical protein